MSIPLFPDVKQFLFTTVIYFFQMLKTKFCYSNINLQKGGSTTKYTSHAGMAFYYSLNDR